MNVARWLRDLGFEAHAEAFAENGIGPELLGDLSNDDLKDLGVSRLADRKRLLAAIADLSSGAAVPSAMSSRSVTAPGERRQVTVLFADIAGFTRLTAELGAENIHTLLNRYFGIVDGVIAGYGGHVDKHIGDNVMAVFGAPFAHDDDPLRALRAAFDIHEKVGQLRDSKARALEVHVGIASGQVVASGTGSDEHREYTVTGDSVNLAARLQATAAPGETLISDAMHRAVAHVVDCESLGQVEVRGMDRPVAVWRVRSQRIADTPALRMPFIGREAELGLIAANVKACKDTGRGRCMVIRGDAGIGKTRLLEEFVRIATRSGFRVYRGLVFDFGVGEAGDAVRAVVQGLLGIPSGSDKVTRQSAADEAFARGILGPERRVYLNDLLDLSQTPEERAIYDAMANTTRIAGKRAVVGELLRAFSERHPIAVLIEDVHWANPVILGYLASMASRMADCRGLLVVSSRVEGYPLDQAWRSSVGDCPLMTVDLAPLRRDDAIRLAGSFIANVNTTALDCIQRAEGNPLFLEQLLRNVEENSAGEIPASIQSLVLARIDRLPPPEKQALQAASVLGQRFELKALRHLLGSPDYDCRALVERRLIRPEGDGYLFDHALVQEGVFSSLLKERRVQLHRRAAEFFADRDQILNAEHLDRGEDRTAAAAYLNAANLQAEMLRFETTLRLVNRGLELVDDAALECAMCCLKGDALRNTGATESSIAAFEAALTLATDESQRCKALIGLAEGLRIADRHMKTLEVLNDAETAAIEGGLLRERARIHSLRGNTYFPLGRIDECRNEHEKALTLARQVGSPEGEAFALSGLGDAYYMRGQMRTASGQFRACVKLCQEHALRRTEVANRHMIGWSRIHLMEIFDAEKDALASINLAKEVSHPRAELLGTMLAGHVSSEMGHLEKADRFLQHALELALSIGADNFAANTLQFLAQNCVAQGQNERAEAYAAKGLGIVRRVGMTFIGPAVLATKAALVGSTTEAEAMLAEAENILDAGCVGHNHVWFAKSAIGHALRTGNWDLADRYANRLEVYTSAEPLPWSDFLMAKGRALAAWGRGVRDGQNESELRRLASVAREHGLMVEAKAFEETLGSPRDI